MTDTIEIVRWVDSVGRTGWQDMPSIGEMEDLEHLTVGIVVAETDKVLALAQSTSLYRDPGAARKLAEIMCIPKAAILDRREVGAVPVAVSEAP